jgi:hypothetical protein
MILIMKDPRIAFIDVGLHVNEVHLASVIEFFSFYGLYALRTTRQMLIYFALT